MPEPKYAIKGSDEIIGIMWDVGDNREIFVLHTEKLRVDDFWTIRDFKTGEDIQSFDILEILNTILPKV